MKSADSILIWFSNGLWYR